MSNVATLVASRLGDHMSSHLDGGVSSLRICTFQINTYQMEIL